MQNTTAKYQRNEVIILPVFGIDMYFRVRCVNQNSPDAPFTYDLVEVGGFGKSYYNIAETAIKGSK